MKKIILGTALLFVSTGAIAAVPGAANAVADAVKCCCCPDCK